MKPEEALENLKVAVNVYHESGDHWNESDNEMDEALKIAIQAIEKQIPKKPFLVETEWLPNNKCICGYIIDWSETEDFKYCPNCGQKIDWEETP